MGIAIRVGVHGRWSSSATTRGLAVHAAARVLAVWRFEVVVSGRRRTARGLGAVVNAGAHELKGISGGACTGDGAGRRAAEDPGAERVVVSVVVAAVGRLLVRAPAAERRRVPKRSPCRWS
jgi:hypothetical protein